MPSSLPTNRPRTVAHVLTSLAIGGAERMALALATEQVRFGDRVYVLSLDGLETGALADAFLAAGVDLVCLPKGSGFSLPLFGRVGRALLAVRPDVVHSHNVLPLIYAAPTAARMGIRTVHTKHGPHPDTPRRLLLRRAAALSVSAFVAVSRDTADAARTLEAVAPDRVHVIANGIDPTPYARSQVTRTEVRAEWGVPGDAQVIGTVGRLEPVKNHTEMVLALAPLLGPTCQFVIAGEGSERNAIQAAAERARVSPWVRLLGRRNDIPRVLQGFDVFALGSQVEGQPLAVLEAMAATLPVVATAVGGLPEAFGGVAMLVPPADARSLREAVLAMLEDESLAEALGGRGRALVAGHHSSRRMRQAYDRVYAAGSDTSLRAREPA